MTWAQLVVGLVSGLMVLAGTVVSSRMSARVGEKATEVDQRANHTADWNAFTQRLEAWTERQLKEQDERTEQQLAERDRRIDRLEDRLGAVEGKYRLAVAYIRRLVLQLQRHVPPEQIERPPDEIMPDL